MQLSIALIVGSQVKLIIKLVRYMHTHLFHKEFSMLAAKQADMDLLSCWESSEMNN